MRVNRSRTVRDSSTRRSKSSTRYPISTRSSMERRRTKEVIKDALRRALMPHPGVLNPPYHLTRERTVAPS